MPETPEVVFIDEHLLILHKPSGMPSEPTKLSAFGSATAWVEKLLTQQKRPPPDGRSSVLGAEQHAASKAMSAFSDAQQTRAPLHPFIAAAHRLDTPTSGLLCIGLSKKTAGALQAQFTEHSAQRTYLAIVEGVIPWEERLLKHHIEVDKSRSIASVVAAPRGREALSTARVLQRSSARTCVLLQPATGLTHQLRVQLQASGHPIIGDSRYGGGGAGRIALHAWSLSLKHPATKAALWAESPPTKDFWALWR